MIRWLLVAACAASPPALENRGAPRCDLPIDVVGDADHDGKVWKVEVTLDATGAGLVSLGEEIQLAEMVFTLAAHCDDGRIRGAGEATTLDLDLHRGTGVATSARDRWTLHGMRRR